MKDEREIILSLIAEICELDDSDMEIDEDIYKKGYIDSMGIVELLSRIEEELDVCISLDNISIEAFSTPKKILDYIRDNKM